MNILSKLKNRLALININIEYLGNYPWVYLDSVNGNRVKREDYTTNHGYTIAYLPIRDDEEIEFAESIESIFKIIRKYK